ncbi:MAG: hypothetical protein RI575_02895 [Balneolaceae bacterium]|nr:hypothetical protein [Balneolaceae bacterium]MDR9408688.1 hypothetical protein [Balneolaceae bacterium]
MKLNRRAQAGRLSHFEFCTIISAGDCFLSLPIHNQYRSKLHGTFHPADDKYETMSFVEMTDVSNQGDSSSAARRPGCGYLLASVLNDRSGSLQSSGALAA